MDLSCGMAPGPRTLEYARLAESLGYRRIWLYDSPAVYRDVWVALAEVALGTRRIGLGPAVLVPSLRHVMANAAAIATLEELAPGRLAVVLGTGFSGRHLLGQRPIAWPEVARYLRALRALLRGEVVEVDGRALQMRHLPGYAAPRPLATPILVAADGPRGRAVARELADGVMSSDLPPADFRWRAWVRMGTVLEPGESPQGARALEAVGPGLAMLYHAAYERGPDSVDALPGGRAWRLEIESLREETRHLQVHDAHLVGLTALDRRHLDPALMAFSFTGTRAELRKRFAELEAQGVTELVYSPMGPDVPRELRAMAEVAGIDGYPHHN
jgi:5,10-methylenetetrahydromethanopterin reductase